jgi:HAD superfamily hydrolase (TIGR01509 family)
VQAIIFDFDGLILDTETPEFEVWSETFRFYGVEMPPNYWTEVIGRGAEQEIERPPELLHRMAPSFPNTPETFEAIRRKIRERIACERARPGIVRMLDQARDRRLPLAVASSSRHVWVDGFLTRLGLADRFQAVCCADDVTRAKPFPDLYLLACQRLNVRPSNAVALEDSPNGIAAAKAAGLYTVAVPNSVTSRLDLSAANRIVANLEDESLESLDFASAG